MMNRFLNVLAICLLSLLAAWPGLADQPGSGQDNVLIDISAGLLQALVPPDIDETQDQRDVILEIPVVARARVRAKGQATLFPDANNAVLDFTLRGTSMASLVATPPDQAVIAYANSATYFTVGKRIYLNSAGLGSYPARATARVNIELKKITTTQGRTDTPLTNVAEVVFEVQKRPFENSGARKSEAELTKQVDDQFRLLLTQANKSFSDGLSQIRAVGVPLRQLRFSTSSSLMSVGARIALTDAGPPLTPVPRLEAPFDLGLRVHQSAINEGAQSALAGKTFSASDLSTIPLNMKMLAHVAAAHVMLEQVAREPIKDASLTFADHAPLVVVFAHHGFTVTANVKEFRAAGLRLPGLTVKAVYKLTNAAGRCEAVRQGPVQISPYYGHKIGSHVLGALLEHRLNATFKERIAIPDLQPPATLSQIGTLVPVRADADNGWIVACWARKK